MYWYVMWVIVNVHSSVLVRRIPSIKASTMLQEMGRSDLDRDGNAPHNAEKGCSGQDSGARSTRDGVGAERQIATILTWWALCTIWS